MNSLLSAFFALILAISVLVKIYVKLTTGWCKSQSCLVGKTAIVTGANTGIGYETALDFAKRGARVILACRDPKRAQEARVKIMTETGNSNVVVRLVDLSSFESVRKFSKKIQETEERLDILVNNAGVRTIGNKTTEDGHPLMMRINYFSAFLLTNLLIGLMKKYKGSRVINVSSFTARFIFDFEVKDIHKSFGDQALYRRSKFCNILFTRELAKRLKGTGITTYSVHPGIARTGILRNGRSLNSFFQGVARSFFFKTSVEAAQTTIHCSLARGIEFWNGEHFEDCKRVKAYKSVAVPGLSTALWDVTQEVVHLRPEEAQI